MPAIESMESLLMTLLRMSWQASILVLLVLLAQGLMRHCLTPVWRSALWFLVVARLLLPIPATPVERIDLHKVAIRFDAPYQNVRLSDLLEAIVRSADKPIRYFADESGVVFTQAPPRESHRPEARLFRVNIGRFLENEDEVRDLFASVGVDLQPPHLLHLNTSWTPQFGMVRPSCSAARSLPLPTRVRSLEILPGRHPEERSHAEGNHESESVCCAAGLGGTLVEVPVRLLWRFNGCGKSAGPVQRRVEPAPGHPP